MGDDSARRAGRPERPLDPESGPVARFAWELRQLRAEAGSPSYRVLARRAHYAPSTLAEAAQGNRLPTLEAAVALATACGGDRDEWTARWRAVAALVEPGTSAGHPRNREAAGSQECPYPGLASFEAADARYFFGRDALVEQLTRHVTGSGPTGVIALFGVSGSGKSSLVRAGLLPRLGTAWQHMLLTPGAGPLDGLAAAVAALTGTDKGALRDAFATDPQALRLALSDWTSGRPSQSRVLLVVDQFEEAFTMGASPQERDLFLALLADTAQAADDRVRLLLVTRADFYAHCSRHPRLVAALRDGVHLPVGPLSDEELTSVIAGPARLTGRTVDPALAEALRTDTAEQPGALALLAHALRQTWLRHTGNQLRLADYQAGGGVRGAVAQSAEQVYASGTPAQQRLLRAVFLRLTVLGDGTDDTRRRIRRAELHGLANPAETDRLLDELARARLVVLGEDTVDVAHEAVIAAWPRLRRWLVDDRDALRAHRRLTQAAGVWHESGRDRSTLYRGSQLRTATAWMGEHPGQLNEQETAFLTAGLAAHRRRRWVARSLTATVTVLAVLAMVAAVLAAHGQREAGRQRDLALSRSVAAQASAVRQADPALSVQLSLAAHRLAPTVEARSSLLSAFAQPYATRLTGHRDHVNTMVFAPGGALAATASRDGTSVLWETHDPRRPRRVSTLRGHTANVSSAAFAPDGRTLATTGWDDLTLLWDVTRPAAPRLRATLPGHGNDVNTAAFSADGHLLATGSTDRTVRLWDAATAGSTTRPLAVLRGHKDAVIAAAFAPRGRILATADWTGSVRLWDVSAPAGPRTLSVLPRAGGPVTAAFAPVGHLLVTAGQDRTVRLWDVGDPGRPRRTAALRGHTDAVRAVRISPDGTRLVTAGADHSLLLWRVRDGRVPGGPRVLEGHTDAVVSVDFSPDGRFLASSSDDRTARLWDLSGPWYTGHTDSVYGVAVRPDGGLAASAGYDRTVRLWPVTGPGRRRAGEILAGHGDAVNSVDFDRTGTVLASASADRTVRLWNVTDPASPRATAVLRDHTDAVNIAVFDRGRDKVLLTGGTDRAARLWDVGDRRHPRVLSRLTGHTDAINSAVLRGGLAVTASADHTARLWDVADPRRPRPVAILRGHTDAVKSVALSPDGRRLATASADRTVRLWDIGDRARPKALRSLTGHVNTVHAVAYSADGRFLASAGADHAVRVWSLDGAAVPKPYATLTGHRDTVDTLAFTARGHTLLTGSLDSDALMWTLDPGRVSRQICEKADPPLGADEWRTHLPGTPVQRLC
ncbi:hypothetical protein [Streptomyces sp. NPDC006285]|uniref:nSTAND1 domain-containing NTPase n=1 Tax=Streptomyces sp. NPDC006285 TaxID=3364742 RepID=UPI00367BC4B3